MNTDKLWLNPTNDELAEEIKALADLSDALKQIIEHKGPTSTDYSQAPYLENYQLRGRITWCLGGDVANHPTLGTRRIHTSELYVLDQVNRWARTRSRWYRLGQPSKD